MIAGARDLIEMFQFMRFSPTCVGRSQTINDDFRVKFYRDTFSLLSMSHFNFRKQIYGEKSRDDIRSEECGASKLLLSITKMLVRLLTCAMLSVSVG